MAKKSSTQFWQVRKTWGVTGVVLLAASIGLTACSQGSSGATDTSSPNSSQSASESDKTIAMQDAYTKASSESMPGMVGSFGNLENLTGEDLKIVSASSPASPRVELHETVEVAGSPKMQEAEGGLSVPAHSTLVLAPGGYHIMLMDLPKELQPGENIEITLTTDGGKSLTFESPVKDIVGGNESYHGGEASGGGHEGHGSEDTHEGDAAHATESVSPSNEASTDHAH